MAKRKPEMRTRGTTPHGEHFHYFASSVAEWRTGTDLDALIKAMKRGGFPFNIYRVDLPETAEYEIDYYRPQVGPGKLHFVGFWDHVNAEEPA